MLAFAMLLLLKFAFCMIWWVIFSAFNYFGSFFITSTGSSSWLLTGFLGPG